MPLSTRCLVLILPKLFPHEEHLSVGGVQKTGDRLQKSGLAGAVGPDESHDGPFLHLEGHIRKGPDVPVGDA